MVFGPILDALAARERGVSVVQVLSEGNRLVAARLSFQAKLVFWLTNVPYWALAVELCTGAPPLVAGPRGAHALAAIIVATASTIFHGSVLFGPVNSAWPPRLLRADIICANGYGRVPVFARRFTLCAASIWTAAAFPCRCGQIKTERLYCDLCVVPWHLAHTVVLCHLALLVSFGLSHDS